MVDVSHENRIAASIGKIRRSVSSFKHDDVLKVFTRNHCSQLCELGWRDVCGIDTPSRTQLPRDDHAHGATPCTDVGDAHPAFKLQHLSKLRDIVVGLSDFGLYQLGWTLSCAASTTFAERQI